MSYCRNFFARVIMNIRNTNSEKHTILIFRDFSGIFFGITILKIRFFLLGKNYQWRQIVLKSDLCAVFWKCHNIVRQGSVIQNLEVGCDTINVHALKSVSVKFCDVVLNALNFAIESELNFQISGVVFDFEILVRVSDNSFETNEFFVRSHLKIVISAFF